MRKILMLVFGLFIAVSAVGQAPQAASAAPVSLGGIQQALPPQAVKTQWGYRHHGYRGYGYRRYGYRPYGVYRPYGYYRPRFYGRRCVIRGRTFFNGYRYVRRPVRVCY
ncbi:MAG: hypothetical protein K2P80_12245 [Beijerinckiaceae bacterium]|nr:hypothetical protein [Beijerinckiaceae bacterium]